MAETVTTQPDGIQLPISSLPQNFVWNANLLNYIEVEYPSSSGNKYRQTFNYSTGRSVTGVSIGSGGVFSTYNGYTLTGPGEGAVLTPVFELEAIAIVSGGTGYTNGDILDLVAGTHSAIGKIQVTGVSGGVITSAVVSQGGTYTAIPPGSSQPLSVTGGTGAGATFNVQWTIDSMTLVEEGTGYTGASGITFNTSGTQPTGTLTLTSDDVTNLDSITGWELQA